MTVRADLPVYEPFHVLRNASVRMGIYVGIILSIVFSGWVIVANHVPSLDRFALARNLAAVVLLGLVALIPVLRFWRMPGNLLASSLVAWVLFSLAYRVLVHGFQRTCGAIQRRSDLHAWCCTVHARGFSFLDMDHHPACSRVARISSQSSSELIANEILPILPRWYFRAAASLCALRCDRRRSISETFLARRGVHGRRARAAGRSRTFGYWLLSIREKSSA